MPNINSNTTETNIHKEADMALDSTKTTKAATPMNTQLDQLVTGIKQSFAEEARHKEVVAATTPASTLPLVDRVKAHLDAYNRAVATYDAEHPDDTAAPLYGIADVVKGVSASDIRNGLGFDGHDVMKCIVEEIMREIAGCEYDPWPDLTKAELRFLIGDRKNSTQCPYGLYVAVSYNENQPLTFAERVMADHHRVWLEKGSEAKRKRLAKAQAEVARMTGKAA